jgi:hypothetical protein
MHKNEWGTNGIERVPSAYQTEEESAMLRRSPHGAKGREVQTGLAGLAPLTHELTEIIG